MPSRRTPPPECAQCGATIPPHALACPECGADERTGWREASIYDGLELPDEAWEDDARERGHLAHRLGETDPTFAGPHRVNGIAWYWWCVGVGLLLLLGLWLLGLR
ncbi:zinc ribbon domain-containing protein [Opitutus terrae]|uniref:zinc ribbon domain-containing protein n=1 Tax=Opitutus terrae TaxID=107709 RepID=UPI0009FD3688|nr:zinc ribbon domain-containing protein [Opitutus terrae]